MKENAERTAHAAFEDLAQHIWDQHKIRVHSVRFEWFEVSQHNGMYNTVQGTSIDSESYRSER